MILYLKNAVSVQCIFWRLQLLHVNETASFQKSIHYIPEERNYNNLRLMRNTFYNGYF